MWLQSSIYLIYIDSNFVHLGHPLVLPSKDRASAYNFVLEILTDLCWRRKRYHNKVRKEFRISPVEARRNLGFLAVGVSSHSCSELVELVLIFIRVL
jgi:hypothetical protein